MTDSGLGQTEGKTQGTRTKRAAAAVRDEERSASCDKERRSMSFRVPHVFIHTRTVRAASVASQPKRVGLSRTVSIGDDNAHAEYTRRWVCVLLFPFPILCFGFVCLPQSHQPSLR
jgi:hypothetical protein